MAKACRDNLLFWFHDQFIGPFESPIQDCHNKPQNKTYVMDNYQIDAGQ